MKYTNERCIEDTNLLYKVHAFGRLDSVCIVNYVGNIMFGTQSSQFLKSRRQDNE